MSRGPNDLILRPPYLGVGENIELVPGAPAAPDAQYDLVINNVAADPTTVILFAPGQGDGLPQRAISTLTGNRATGSVGSITDFIIGPSSANLVLNDPSTTPTTVILWRYGQGDGHALHRDVQLTGLRAFIPLGFVVMDGGNIVQLTGQIATATAGTFQYELVGYRTLTDNLSDTFNLLLSLHTADSGTGWTAGITTGFELRAVFSGRFAQNNGSDEWNGYNVQPVQANKIYIQAGLVRNSNTLTAGVTNVISEGITFRNSVGGTFNYQFGWCEFDAKWYLKRRDNTYVKTDLASSTTNILVNPGDAAAIVIIVTDGVSSVHIECYVNNTLVIDYTDSSAGRLMHTATDRVGLAVQWSDVVEFDYINLVENYVLLTGLRLTTTSNWLFFDSLLQHQSATVTGGTLTPVISMGSAVTDTSIPIPNIDVTKTSVGSGSVTVPAYIRHAFLPRGNVYEAAGEQFLRLTIDDGTRVSGIQTNPITHNDWSSSGGAAVDELNYFGGVHNFPRFGLEQPSLAEYNTGPVDAGLFSVDPDGGLHTLHNRQLSSNFYEINSGWQSYSQSEDYEGPELAVGIGYLPMGIYGWAAEHAVGFYPKDSEGNTNRLILTAPSGDPTTIVLTAQTSIVPAFRTVTRGDSAWSEETTINFASGGNHYSVSADHMTFVPSGENGVFYAVYLSTEPTGEEYIGIAVINAITSEVISNTLVLSVDPMYTANKLYVESNSYTSDTTWGERSVAEVAHLSTGVNVTQFMLHGNIVHVTWNDATPRAPVMTLKPGPTVRGNVFPTELIIRRWGSLEIRGDRVYHVLYRILDSCENVNHVYVNDATRADDPSWVLTTCTYSGDVSAADSNWPGEFGIVTSSGSHSVTGGDYFSGFGYGKDTWLQVGRESTTSGLGYDVAVWVSFWDNQPTFFSVQAVGRVGQVHVVITPDVALTGLRAITASGADSPFPLQTGDAHAWLVGKRLTTSAGRIAPPPVPFVVDTFTDVDNTHLLLHTGELGATWSGVDLLEVETNQLQEITNGSFAINIASGQAATADYQATIDFSTTTSGSHLSGHPELGVGVRFNASRTDGYVHGYNPVEHLLYLYKYNSHAETFVLATASVSLLSGKLNIEVNGTNPTRLTCRVTDAGGVETEWVVYDDYGVQYTDKGYVAVWFDGFLANVGSLDNLNATYYDPSVLILNGLRATTAQGTMYGPWPTGQRATTAQGVLTPSVTAGGGNVTQALTGLSATTSQGTISVVGADTLIGLLGIQIVASAGVMELSMRLLTGQSATCTAGTLGIVVDCFPAATGLRLTTAQGALRVVSTVPLTGLSLTTTSGTLTVVVGATLQGRTATATAGILTRTVENIVALVGNRANTSFGTLTPVTAEGSSLAGQVASCTGGVLKPTVNPTLTGAVATTRSGVVSVTLACSLTGLICTTSQHGFTVSLSIQLTGQLATTRQGVLGVTHDCNLFITGVYCTGYVGDVTGGFPKIKGDVALWALTEVEKLFAQEVPNEDFPVVDVN